MEKKRADSVRVLLKNGVSESQSDLNTVELFLADHFTA